MNNGDIKNLHRFFHAYINYTKLEKEEDKHLCDDLGNGYELRYIQIFTKSGKEINNSSRFSYLYCNGVKICNTVFRKGGMGGKFKDGYCTLIAYNQEKPHSEKKHGFGEGTFVIINQMGDILLKNKYGSIHHLGGCLAYTDKCYYDLRTQSPIMPYYSNYIKGKKCIIVKHEYEWNNKEINRPLGIYKINIDDALITKIDEIK